MVAQYDGKIEKQLLGERMIPFEGGFFYPSFHKCSVNNISRPSGKRRSGGHESYDYGWIRP